MKEKNKFITNILIFSFIPVLVLALTYLIYDPFILFKEPRKNLKNYVEVNRGHFNARLLLKNKELNTYNSFLLASSRGLFFNIDKWSKLSGDSSFSGFHFEDNRESIFGMYKKIKFLDDNGFALKNVLLLLDHEVFKVVTEKNGYLDRVSPIFNNKITQRVLFYYDHLEAYFSPKFFIPFLINKITNEYFPFMNGVITPELEEINYKTNQMSFLKVEEKIEKNEFYTEDLIEEIVSSRKSHPSNGSSVIREKQKKFLNKISDIFKEHGTNLRVVVNPLTDQLKIDSSSLGYLKKTFGKDNVFDFSGKNDITKDYRNYYEKTHYRVHIADKILEEIYAK